MTVREFLRGAVTLHVLHHAAQSPVNGAWLSSELADHGYRISPGTLYPLLHRLEADGLLRSRREVVGGRARRSYTVTSAGEKALEQLRHALRELADEVLADTHGRPRHLGGRGGSTAPSGGGR
jgi:DNA-binding PadR family transcriptional regulator